MGVVIGSDVVGEVAAGAKDDLNGVAKVGGGEDVGYDVVPCGAGAGEEDGLALESRVGGELASEVDGVLEEGSDGGFVVEDTFVELDSAERDGGAPTR